ncbi:type VII secretion target [Saccharopolyspora taberi]|uniref:type VII secretion target n=1 Tax=Saccharopolyspora taberi TaxID=60895 RepID=UPI0031CED7B8
MTGIGANTGELASAATSIKGCSDAIGELKKGIESSQVREGDFGREHKDPGKLYFDGLKKLAKAIEKNAQVTDDYANKLNSAARGYEWDDAENAKTVQQSGGGQ